MAIDTAAKRLAVMDMDDPGKSTGPLPDGSFDAADRAHLVWLYYIPSGPPPPPEDDGITVLINNMRIGN